MRTGSLNFLLVLALVVFSKNIARANSCAVELTFGNHNVAQLEAPNDKHRFHQDYPKEVAAFNDKFQKEITGLLAVNKNKGFAVLTVEEVNNAAIQRLGQALKYPNVVASQGRDSNDSMNIGVLSQLPMKGDPIFHDYWNGSPKLRPIVEVNLVLPNGEDLFLYSVHLPSLRSIVPGVGVRRQAALDYIYQSVADHLAKDPQAKIVAMGDWNHDPTDPEMIDRLHTAPVPQNLSQDAIPQEAVLFNLNPFMNVKEKTEEFMKNHPNATPAEVTAFAAGWKKTYATNRGQAATKSLENRLARFKNRHPLATQDEIAAYTKEQQKVLAVKANEPKFQPKGSWGALGNILVSRGMLEYYVPESFTIEKTQPFVNKDGNPTYYDPATGQGLSDHIPFEATFRIPLKDN